MNLRASVTTSVATLIEVLPLAAQLAETSIIVVNSWLATLANDTAEEDVQQIQRLKEIMTKK